MRKWISWTRVFIAMLSTAAVISCGGGGGGEGDGGGGKDDQPTLPSSMTLVSAATDGTQANNDSSYSYSPSISSDGRYVAFYSYATNLVGNDTNQTYDVFVRDLLTRTSTRVSVASDGSQADGSSYHPSISASGRYVAFESLSSNLVESDTNASQDIFVHDREAGTTALVSVASDGTQANGNSYYASISGDGRYIVFKSIAANLVAGDTNGYADIFLRDRDTDNDGIFDEAGAAATTRVSVATGGTQSNGLSDDPAISGNGKYVAFTSIATNLATGDTNSSDDIFVRNLQNGTTTRASLATDGTQAATSSGCRSAAISNDGRYIVFESYANNLVAGDTNGYRDIFVRDRDTDNDAVFDETGAVLTTRVNVSSAGIEANGNSSHPSISGDGSYIAFASYADNLAAGYTNLTGDIFVRNYQDAATIRVSNDSGGAEGNGASMYPAISGDGAYVAFVSDAENLVAGDTNLNRDVFVSPR